jgi:16S rRNA (guanine527-N7)-methyltransferase
MTVSARLGASLIEDCLLAYGFSPTRPFIDKVLLYIDLLLRWNRKISLTSLSSPQDILRFHFGESLFAVSIAKIRDGRLADVGSGAGFPGVPLGMAIPSLDVTLIEASAKKAAFLHELQRQLELRNLRVYRGRAEGLNESERFDFATARALGNYRELLAWFQKRTSERGKVLLWLGRRDAGAIRSVAGWTWQEPFPIPATRERFIVIGSRTF